ncbi:MAG: DUF4388 domain-containing protein [Chloroflexaceae bacterium]|jgi:hypothetical protein|nr:DUF4388 domain-containing protein [Chloroflexaceae bacterium]
MSIYGTFDLVSPAGLLQLFCQEQRSVVLVARHDDCRARIYIAEGMIVEATCGTQQDAEAIYAFVNWRGGQFRVDVLEEVPATARMAASWEELLLEAARRRDETTLVEM